MPANSQHNAELNALLETLARSLLQYVGESWPWSENENSSEAVQVRDIIARQQQDIAQLAELLDRRHWPIDFGQYPAEYTDLHYLALDFLLSQLAVSARDAAGEVERMASLCVADHEASQLLEQIRVNAQDAANRLEGLVRVRSRTQPV